MWFCLQIVLSKSYWWSLSDQLQGLQTTERILQPVSRVGWGRWRFPGQVRSLWWRNEIETLSVSLTLCEGNPPVAGGFPSQRARDDDIWCFPYSKTQQPEQNTRKTRRDWDTTVRVNKVSRSYHRQSRSWQQTWPRIRYEMWRCSTSLEIPLLTLMNGIWLYR